MGGNSCLTNVKLSHTQILSGNIQGTKMTSISANLADGIVRMTRTGKFGCKHGFKE